MREFQRIFSLTVDGIIGKATWYRISYLYTSVKRLSELDSEGISLEEISKQFPEILQLGATGDEVRVVQYYLAVIGTFYETVPVISVTGVFDESTRDAVIAFQKTYGLVPDGIIGRLTWQDIYRAYKGILDSTDSLEGGMPLYPGTVLRLGSQGESVRQLQEFLAYIAETYTDIPRVPVTGVFGSQTQGAVIAFQQQFGLNPNGVVGPITWGLIASVYSDLRVGFNKQPGQYPGYELSEEG